MRTLIDTSQDAISNHSIYTCHVQELIAKYMQCTMLLLAAIQKQPTIKETPNHSIVVGQTDTEEPWTLIVVARYQFKIHIAS